MNCILLCRLLNQRQPRNTSNSLAFENLNIILAISGVLISISFPFILRYLSKKDTSQERESHELEDRLDKYEERLRLAEIAIARTERRQNGG